MTDSDSDPASTPPKRGFISRLYQPDPAPPAFGKDKVVPQVGASFLSLLAFQWLSPLLQVGFSRPLQKEDLWQLDEPRLASALANRLETNFYTRHPVELQPAFIKARRDTTASNETATAKGKETAGSNPIYHNKDAEAQGGEHETTAPAEEAGKEKVDWSLLLALNKTFRREFWMAGIFQLIADVITALVPQLTRRLLEFLGTSYYHARYPGLIPTSPPIGRGIGLAIGIFAMQVTTSILTQHNLQKSMTIGMLGKGGVTGLIFRKSLRLSNRARSEHSPGKITTMISSDCARIEEAASYAHYLWVGPIQFILGVGFLISTLGYSALVGLGFILLSFPLQGLFIWSLFERRQKTVAVMDKRVRLLQEVLHGIRVVKIFAWEGFFSGKIDVLRRSELRHIRIGSLSTAALISSFGFIPISASILSFITYSLSGHDLDPAIIFTSLQYFNIIRIPLILIPIVASSVAQAIVALQRISPFLLAEELLEPYEIDPSSEFAVKAEGDFAWEKTQAEESEKQKDKKEAAKDAPKTEKSKEKKNKEKKSEKKAAATDPLAEKSDAKPSNPDAEAETIQKPFELTGVELEIENGSFVTIVGKIGSGKSSLVQSIIGEMRRTRGHIVLSGNAFYLPQIPWILNATLRENVTFGQDYDEERFKQVIKACQLEPDIAILPNGEMTEIGEKGISLSGGTKARVSLARAAYSGADIVILDDTLSAVDAHVGKAILEQCLLSGPLSTKTRILVTHALHVLPYSDRVFVMDEGKIVERGRYADLVAGDGLFSKLIRDFGSEASGEKSQKNADGLKGDDKKDLDKEEGKGIMQDEERNTGAVPYSTYAKYFEAAGGLLFWGPILLVSLLLNEASIVTVNLFLGFWSSRTLKGFSNGDYMGTYAGLGAVQALVSFIVCYCFSLAGLEASLKLFHTAFRSVMRAPISFFDTSPIGRIVSRLSGDIDILDSQLAFTFYTLASTTFSVVGTIFLVFYTFPYLGIIFVPLGVMYYVSSVYYRRSSVETKRLESILRSKLFAAYSEALTGLPSVRASRREATFAKSVEHGIDLENRAHFITVTLQRWLGIRLDFLGNILVLGISLFSVGFRTTVDPAKVGVVLSYSLLITWVLSEAVNQFATLEQNMNAVERVQHYAEDLPQEAVGEKPDDPSPSWPSEGRISFRDVKLSYRPGLPTVLKGVSFDIKGGEKIGVVGRTGAGKSSLLQALFRIVELEEGAIEVDGVDIKTIGLDTLRRQLGVIPQDVKLFQGTIRDNLDPLKTKTDAELIAALRLANLIKPEAVPEPAAAAAAGVADGATTPVSARDETSRFTLDAEVESEGSNFSAGEGQLLALSRALVKQTRIIVLDEATSSVDVETDASIQAVIASSSSTLLTIAHRLNTVAFYDRILVMNDGSVAEFDTPLTLFDKGPKGSIFRSLCDETGLNREDIVRYQARPKAKTTLEMSEPYDPYLPRGGASSNPTGEPRPAGNAKTAALQADIDHTVGIMRDNITKVAERGERLDTLQDKTDNLAVSAQGFRRGANRVRKNMWWKDMKMRIIIGVGIAILLVIIIVPIVKATQGK